MDELELKRMTENVTAAANRQLLRDELLTSGLPEIAQRKVEKDIMRVFAGRVATEYDIKERIAEEKTFVRAFAGSWLDQCRERAAGADSSGHGQGIRDRGGLEIQGRKAFGPARRL